MKFSSLESVEVRHEALSIIRLHIDVPRRLSDGLKDVRYWREDVLVYDYVTLAGQRFHFDLNCTNNGFSLMVGGRDDPSQYMVLGKLGSATKAIRGRVHRQLAWWNNGTDLRLVAGDVLALMQKAIAAMSVRTTPPLRSVPGYWWDHQTNFGDQVAPWLLEMITGRPAHNVIGEPLSEYGLMSVGSIVTDMNRPGLSIWGSGLISEPSPSAVDRLKTRRPSAIHAVRGQLTRDRLIRHLGWEVPEVYGDPALLLPRFFRPDRVEEDNRRPVVVPHYAHNSMVESALTGVDLQIVNVKNPVEKVVAAIANSEAVVSTSLHGIIIAHAYEVPWTWLRIGDKKLVGDQFKFEDFFSLLSRNEIASASFSSDDLDAAAILKAIDMAVLPHDYFSECDLIDAFPHSELPSLPGEIID